VFLEQLMDWLHDKSIPLICGPLPQDREVEEWVRILCAFWRMNYVQLKGNFKTLVNSSRDEVS